MRTGRWARCSATLASIAARAPFTAARKATPARNSWAAGARCMMSALVLTSAPVLTLCMLNGAEMSAMLAFSSLHPAQMAASEPRIWQTERPLRDRVPIFDLRSSIFALERPIPRIKLTVAWKRTPAPYQSTSVARPQRAIAGPQQSATSAPAPSTAATLSAAIWHTQRLRSLTW